MNETVGDPWGVPGAGQISGPQMPMAPLPTAAPRAERGRNGLTIAAAVLLFAAGAVYVVGMFTYRGDRPLDSRVFDWPSSLATWVWYAVWFLVLGGLLLSKRWRDLGLGLTVALAVTWPAAEIVAFRPSDFEPHGEPGNVLPYDATLLLLMAAGVVAGIELWRGRRQSAGADMGMVVASPAPSWRVRVQFAVCGTAAAVVWFVGDVLNWSTDRISYTVAFGSLPYARSTTCCTFNEGDAWGKAGMIDSVAVLVLFAVLAAVARSAKVSAGFLAGGVLLLGAQVVETTVTAITPGPSLYGSHETARLAGQVSDLSISSTPLAGFWIAAGALAFLLVLALLRLRSRSQGHNVSAARRTEETARLSGL